MNNIPDNFPTTFNVNVVKGEGFLHLDIHIGGKIITRWSFVKEGDLMLLEQINNKKVQQPTFNHDYTFVDLMQVQNDYLADPVLYFSSGLPIRSCISDETSIAQLVSFCIVYRLCLHYNSQLILIHKLLDRKHPLEMFDHKGDNRLNSYCRNLADTCEINGYFVVDSDLRVKGEHDFRKVEDALFGMKLEISEAVWANCL